MTQHPRQVVAFKFFQLGQMASNKFNDWVMSASYAHILETSRAVHRRKIRNAVIPSICQKKTIFERFWGGGI